jgi:phosphotriesterase-related protein
LHVGANDQVILRHHDDMNERVGRIQTVRGLIDPADLGQTLMHEHLLFDLRPMHRRQTWDTDGSFANAKSTPDIRSRVQWDWFANLDELYVDDEALVITEVERFRKAGGSAIVDCTTVGLSRDPQAIRRISEATGVHVTMGAGFYQDRCIPARFDSMSEDEVAEEIVRDIETGVPGAIAPDGSPIRAGHIGEIGMTTPTERELKSLRAAARAQGRTGAMLNIHQSYTPGDRAVQHMLADTIEQNGGNLHRTVFSHMDRTGQDLDQQLSLLRRGITISYDEFGYEVGNRSWDRSSIQDVQRVREIARLAEAGFVDQLAVAHDISFKRMLVANGGWGFAHLLERVLDGFRWAGMSDADINQVLVATPRRLLAFVAPAA